MGFEPHLLSQTLSGSVVLNDRILANQAMMQLLSVKLETEGEDMTIAFVESLGCDDVPKVLEEICRQFED